MKNKNSNGNGVKRDQIDEERQEIRSILEDLSKDISRDWEKITCHASFKSKYNLFINDLLPKILDIFIELEKEWNLEAFKENPENFTHSFIPSFKYTPDFDIYRKFEVKDIKTIHQLNQFIMGHIIALLKQGGELVTYLNLTEPNHDDSSHIKNIMKSLALCVTRYLIKFTNQYKLISHRDLRAYSPDKLEKYSLVEDMVTLQKIIIERNTLITLMVVRGLKQDLFSLYNSLYINQDNWKEVQDLL